MKLSIDYLNLNLNPKFKSMIIHGVIPCHGPSKIFSGVESFFYQNRNKLPTLCTDLEAEISPLFLAAPNQLQIFLLRKSHNERAYF